MDYIEYELDKLYANQEFYEKMADKMVEEGLDPSDPDEYEKFCIDYDDYCRGLHEDCEVV